MEHLREPKAEEVQVIVEEQSLEEHKSVVLSDLDPPTRDVFIRGRGKATEMGAPISASLGAMRPLVGKLNMLLLGDAPQKCSSERVKNGVRLLKHDVEKISAYLDDLSEVEDPPPTANCWMNEARDLSYDMEDYIDSLLFVPTEDKSLVANTKTSSFRKKFSRVKTPKSIKLDEQILERLSKLRMYIQEAVERHKRYGVHFCSTLRRRFVSPGPMLPTQYDEETVNVVIDDRMKEFMNSLASDGDQQLKVVSVFGSTCLGKTTLARVLYKNLCEGYDCRAFIQVSKKPDMKKIYRDMLLQLQREDPPKFCEEMDLIDRIKEYLQHKRYLIIIDDVWDESVWDIISHVFPKGNHCSRIIATTQIEDVALACCYQPEHVFEMKPLDDDHSRRLFFNRLFGSEHDCPDELIQVCTEIVEICGGLPLATISIASLLASQPVVSVDLLTYIHHSLSSLSAKSTSERTRQILNLSFNCLPHFLKTCLLYLSMYPEGYIFSKDDLVKQWMAESFIDTTEGQDMYKVAESYLGQLIGRRFIQPIWINYNSEVLSCAVHDVVHDLIVHKSAEENFIAAINYSQNNLTISHKARRLSLLFGDARCAPANITKSQVRSLRFFGLLKYMPCIGDFKVLRVLNLQLSGHPDNNLADLTMISELCQLRYLKIACDVYIKLPNHGLQYLETLDITDAEVDYTVPWDIHLPHLLHLSLPLEKRLLDGICSTGRVNYLENLHLTPSVFNLERNMEALGYLVGGHENLRAVVVTSCLSVENILECSALNALISWDDLAPPPLLQRFECSPRSCIIFCNIPKWVGKLGNLCILKIAVTKLMMNCVDILSELPALTALSLYVDRAPTEGVIFDKSGFSVLKYFKLRFTSGIAWIKFEADAMPNLLKLKLFNAVVQPFLVLTHTRRYKQYECGNAQIIIEHMPSLKEIYTKFGGASASNHLSYPMVNMQLVDNSSYGEEITNHGQQPDEILEEEPSGFHKQQHEEIMEKESHNYDKIVERPADKRMERFPEYSSPPHVPDEVRSSKRLTSQTSRHDAKETAAQQEPAAGDDRLLPHEAARDDARVPSPDAVQEQGHPPAKDENKWTSPAAGFLKLNVSADFDEETGSGAFGVILRDSDGMLVAACSRFIPHALDVPSMEAEALLEGLKLAEMVGCKSITAESDLEGLVNTIASPSLLTGMAPGAATIYHDCLAHLAGFSSAAVVHCPWEANAAAFELGNYSFNQRLSEIWKDQPPGFLINTLAHDRGHPAANDETKWTRPAAGFLKLNVGAAFSVETSSGAFGVIIRDSEGQFKASYSRYKPYVTDFPSMQAEALLEGLKLARTIRCKLTHHPVLRSSMTAENRSGNSEWQP